MYTSEIISIAIISLYFFFFLIFIWLFWVSVAACELLGAAYEVLFPYEGSNPGLLH